MKALHELLDLTGKVAIVTGGAKGIGEAIVSRLAEAGAMVIIADLDTETGAALAARLSGEGCKASFQQTDVSDETQVQALVQAAVGEFGSVDILVNNAGIYPPVPVSQMSLEQFEQVIHVNLRSAFLTTKHVAAQMKSQGRGGRIVNITSIDALHPSMVGLAHYDASKHGMWGFTKNAALEYAPDQIWINAVAPGGIATPGTAAMSSGAPAGEEVVKAFLARIPMGRMGEGDDIGKAVLFLASELSSYMTGSQIVVDGGVLLR